MAHPRFALVVGGRRSRNSPSFWPYADSRPVAVSLDGSWFAWRLLGGNNRELGRSATVYPSVDGCRQAAATVRAGHAELTPVLVTDPQQGRWRWRLELPSGAVAVSPRTYLRQRECQYNLAHFAACVGIAWYWDGGGAGLDSDEGGAGTAPDAAVRVVIDLTGDVPTRRLALPEPDPGAVPPRSLRVRSL